MSKTDEHQNIVKALEIRYGKDDIITTDAKQYLEAVETLLDAASDAMHVLNPERGTYVQASTLAFVHKQLADAIEHVRYSHDYRATPLHQ